MDRFQLPWKDSNSHKRNQNPVCYHYTTRQCFVVSFDLAFGLISVPFDDAKLQLFSILTKYSGKKMTQKINFFCVIFILV